MRWEDEPYVKLYTRDTPTWKGMAWQGRALLPVLMRKLDKAGLLECGDLGRGAVSLMVDLPEEVVGPGLATLEKFGVITWLGDVLLMSKFEEAQEAKKTELLKKRDQRRKAKDKARAEAMKAQHEAASQPAVIPKRVSPSVPDCPEVSQLVPLQTAQTHQPSPDTPAQPRHTSPAVEEAAPPATSPPPEMEVFAWCQEARRRVVAGVFPENPPAGYLDWFTRALGEVGSPDRLCRTYAAFLRDDWARARRPTFAFTAFIGQDKWREFVPPKEQAA